MHTIRRGPSRRPRTVMTLLASLAILLAAPAVLAGGRQEAPTAPPPRTDTPEASEPTGEESLLPLDDATAQALVQMGMIPFEERIPSEDFTLALLGEGESSLSDHEGRVVFLNFWATWCPPCREEMPAMQALYDELRDSGLEMLAVNVLEDQQTAGAFIDEFGFTYPVLMDRDGRVMLRYGVRAYPTTYLIDREGYVIGVKQGYHDWAAPDVVSAMRVLLDAE